MKLLTLKKIIPVLLITAVLFTGFFGVVGVSTVNAAVDYDPTDLSSSGQAKTTAAEKKLEEENSENLITGCSLWPGSFHFSNCANAIFAIIGNTMMNIFAFFTGVSGYILDKAVDYTIVGMGANTEKIGAIEKGWKTFRDLSNIVIIFVLLVIGIATILRLENYGAKALLAKLIIVALLINFSLFFTQVVIDSSNLISLQFYNKITTTKDVVSGEDIIVGVSERYMQAFGLTSLYDGGEIIKPDRLSGANKFWEIFIVSVLGSVVFLVAAFAFLAGAFLLVSRFVVLVFLMILAPLAFVGMILPALSKHAGKWWSALIRYAFFAPAYMILTWFVIEVINSPAFREGMGLDAIGKDGASTFTKIVTGGGTESMALIFNFIIIIAFIIASVLISNYFGIMGSDAVMKWGGAARKFGQGVVGGATFGVPGRFLRTTVGRGASKLSDSERIKERASGGGVSGVVGRMQLRGLRGVAGSSFDVRATKAGGAIAGAASLGKAGGKGGYEAQLKQQVKSREKFAQTLGTESFDERLYKDRLAKDIRENEDKLKSINNEIKQVEIAANSPTESQIKEDAKIRLQVITAQRETIRKEITITKSAEKEFKPGMERQYKYADTLEKEKTIDTAFTKVPRKGKESALAIRKAIKNKPQKNILDSISKAMKADEDDSGESKEKPEEDTSKTT
jgi:hypothetical protein